MRRIRNFIFSISIVALLSSCGPVAASKSPAATPAASNPTDLPSNVSATPPALEATPSPTPSPESKPTRTEPAPTPSPEGLNPAGPYAVFAGSHGIWITNPDGSFPTRLADQGLGNEELDLHDALAPQGDRIALISADKTGLNLITIEIPGGRTRTVSRLLEVTQSKLRLNSLSPEAFAYRAVTEFPNLAWEPSIGQILAYVGAEESPTTDLYTFREERPPRRLEQNPAQAVRPIWSPNGDYLLYFEVNWLPPFGATYVTFQPMAGFRAVRISDGQVIPQSAPKGTYRNFIGWRDDTHYLLYDSDEECGARNLRSVDLTAGETESIADFCFSSPPAWSDETRSVILSAGADCACPVGEGVFLFAPGRADPVRLLEKSAYAVYWLPDSGVFYAYPDALFSADGNTRYDPPLKGFSYLPAVSRSGRQAWKVVQNHRSRVVVRMPDGQWRTILEGNASAILWDQLAGDTLLIALEDGALYSAAAPEFTPQLTGRLTGAVDQTAWIA
jgi:hypothetical protein